MTTQATAPAGAVAPPFGDDHGAAPIAALVEVGVLDEIGAAGAEASDISRAHPVWRVRLSDGRRLVVKAGIGHGGPDLAVECLVYRMTWWCEPLAAALPVPLVVDEDRQLLVLSDVTGPTGPGSLAQQAGFPALLTSAGASAGSGTGSGAGGSPVGSATAHALGRTVGTLHRATAGWPLPSAPPPLVLGLVGRLDADGPDSAAAAQLSALGPLVRSTVADLGRRRPIASAVAELRRPVAGCLVHHDLKWDNVVLAERGAGSTEPAPVLLDWELAGLGDPAWDLGCLLAEHLLRSSPPSEPPLDDLARALLAGYRDGARPRAEVASTLARRVVLAAGLRIAQLALEVAYTPHSGDAGAIARLTEAAVAVLAGRQLIEEVQRCLW